MAEKMLNTRIQLKYDSYENWYNNNPQLKLGEVALAYVGTQTTVNNHAVEGVTPPHILMKVGNGTSNYRDLQFTSALAADVNKYAKYSVADFEAAVKALASTEVSGAIAENAEAIEALKGLVGSKSVDSQITDAITALKLADTYAAKVHGHEMSEVNGLEAALEGKQAVGDYATKAEAQGYANAKDESIAAAKKAGDDAQADVDALEGTVSTLSGTVSTNSSDIETMKGQISANAGAVAAEAERAAGVEAGLRTDVDAIKGDYLKASDKESLQNQINLIMNNPDTENVINSINEFTQYIADHGEIADGFRTDIDDNADAIEALDAKVGEVEEGKTVVEMIADAKSEATYDDTALANRVSTNETNIGLLQAGLSTKLEAGVAATTYETKEDAKATKEALEGRLSVVEVKPAMALTAEQIAGYDAAVPVANSAVQSVAGDTGLKATRSGNAVTVALDETVTFIFNCGDSNF